jgi:hypothetical protein
MSDDLVTLARCDDAEEKGEFASATPGQIATGMQINTVTHFHRATTSSPSSIFLFFAEFFPKTPARLDVSRA